MHSFIKKAGIVASFITTLLAGILSFSYLLCLLIHIPLTIDLPYSIRLIGLFPLGISQFFLVWILRYRRIKDIVDSTYLTIMKFLGRITIVESKERKEPLVIRGPYKYARNPMYFGVLMFFLVYHYS
jgi:protein-S-isoprenylcysteine O-methyltransferase Ste14